MTMFRSLTVTAVVAALLAGGVAAAQGPGRGPRGGPGGFRGPGGPAGLGVELPLRQLNLTDQQQQLVRDIGQQYRDQNQKLAERMREATTAHRAAVEKLPVDEGLIRNTMQALADVQTELAIQQARMHAEIFAILTPAQQEQAKKLQAERQNRGRR